MLLRNSNPHKFKSPSNLCPIPEVTAINHFSDVLPGISVFYAGRFSSHSEKFLIANNSIKNHFIDTVGPMGDFLLYSVYVLICYQKVFKVPKYKRHMQGLLKKWKN